MPDETKTPAADDAPKAPTFTTQLIAGPNPHGLEHGVLMAHFSERTRDGTPVVRTALPAGAPQLPKPEAPAPAPDPAAAQADHTEEGQ